MNLNDSYQIGRQLRTNIFELLDGLHFSWSGRSSQLLFLSGLYDLDALPSFDHRFNNAYDDIRQHTENNNDWDSEWVLGDQRFQLLTGSDQIFMAFVVKALSARRDWEIGEQDQARLDINELLKETQYYVEQKYVLSSGAVYEVKTSAKVNELDTETVSAMLSKASNGILEIDYIRKMIVRAANAVDEDSELAVGTAKEILEATYKQLLKRLGISYDEVREQPKDLAKKLYPALALDNLGQDAYFQGNLNALLTAVAAASAVIRNSKGTGHGRAIEANTANHLAKMVLLTICVHCEFLVRQFELNCLGRNLNEL